MPVLDEDMQYFTDASGKQILVWNGIKSHHDLYVDNATGRVYAVHGLVSNEIRQQAKMACCRFFPVHRYTLLIVDQSEKRPSRRRTTRPRRRACSTFSAFCISGNVGKGRV